MNGVQMSQKWWEMNEWRANEWIMCKWMNDM